VRLFLVLLFLLGPLGFAQTAPPLIEAIEIRSDAALPELQKIERLITLQVGEPFTDEAVRTTLRNLQATGQATEIEIHTRPGSQPEGVIAEVVLWRVFEVQEVRVLGHLGIERSEILRSLAQKAAQPLSESKVLHGFLQLSRLYKERGYFQAKIHVEVLPDEVRKMAVVTYRIESGPRATLSAVDFGSDPAPFTPEQLQKQLRLSPGSRYDQSAVQEASGRLRRWLFRQSHGLAEVEPPTEAYDEATNSVRLTYPLSVGPRVTVTVRGGDSKKLEKEGLLPFLRSGYDEALILQSTAKIRRYYQQQGYYGVQVETQETQQPGEIGLEIRIVPGPPFTVESVRFTGNPSYSDDRLIDLMTTSRRRLFALGSGRLVQEELDADLDNLRSFYVREGYGAVRVGPAEVEASGSRLRLTVPIVEGPRQVVGSLELQGTQELSADKLRQGLPLAPEGPFHPLLLEETLNTLRGRYANEGYPQAQVSARTAWNAERTRVDLTFDVFEGPQVVADRIIIRGTQRTRDEVIERAVRLAPGEPVSETRRLEMERALYQLGVFSQVDVQLAQGGLDASSRDVVIRVEESIPHTLIYGVGYDSDSGARGLLGYTHNNVFGRAYTLRGDLRLSQRDERFRLLFDQPTLGDLDVSLNSLLFYEFRNDTDKPYDVSRYVARSEAVHDFGSLRASLAFDYRQVRLEVDPDTTPNQIARRNFPYELTSFIPSLFWDHRRGDNPLEPSGGWSTSFQVQYAFPLRTDAEFLKLFVQQSQYFPLGRSGVLAASLRFGGIEPFTTLSGQDPYVPDELPSSNVFIDERFFAGGDSTLRAYRQDELGIRGETLFQPRGSTGFVPAGGNGLALANLEYRFPVFGDLGGAVFFDSGNVWADWRSIHIRDFKSGIGLGARYRTPVGPLRFDIGWKLDRDLGEDAAPVFFLGFGNPF
jgi:outer membrane protein insertion porin family